MKIDGAARGRLLVLAAALLLPACGGGSGGGAPAGGTHTLLTSGGAGASGDGGDGGRLLIVGARGAPVSIRRGGAVEADEAVPAERPSLGANPRVFSSDAQVVPDGDGRIPGGVDPSSSATGIEVREGATLTLAVVGEQAHLQVPEGAVVAGRIRFGSAGLLLEAGGVRVERTGAIAGTRSAEFEGDEPELSIESAGAVVILGTVSFRGAPGPEGAPGGEVEVRAQGAGNAYCAGTIDVSGGDGSQGDGGAGGELVFGVAGAGAAVNHGALLARGGRGAGRGGDGGEVILGVEGVGGVATDGLLDASGGAGAGVEPRSKGDGDGGDAGLVECFAFGEDVRVAGRVVARGGEGSTGAGGRGGTVLLAASPAEDEVFSGAQTLGRILLGADVDTRGGDGAQGGAGGPVAISGDGAVLGMRPDTTAYAEVPEVALLGYERIDVSGGAGAGGSGGDAATGVEGFLEEPLAALPGAVFRSPGVLVRGVPIGGAGGDVRCEVEITGRGGDALAGGVEGLVSGDGGAGAVVELVKGPLAGGGGGGEATVESLARVDLRGGAGLSGGAGGALGLSDPAHVVCAGEALLDGGASSGEEGTGGAGGFALLFTPGLLEARGSIRCAGGASSGEAGAGGRGGLAVLGGGRIRASGTIACDGGAATGPGGTGGDGGNLRGQGGAVSPGEVVSELVAAMPLPAQDIVSEAGGVYVSSAAAPTALSGTLAARGGGGGGGADGGGGEAGTIAVDGIEAGGDAGVVRR